jgi:ATP-dependent helicase HrpA
MSEAPLHITYPPELPVSAARDEIARAIAGNQVVIVAGATGSGKTTQLPKICLDLGRDRIAHTQPRRIAARSIAERIAEELGVELGGVVGYQVRFDDRSARDTRIKLMTDGVLLAEINRDRELRRYDTIILDEAHERSLTIDFLLGYLRELLPRRPELKVIVTSATIDPASFAAHFASADGTPAPIVEVSGRTYPVEIRYRPLVAEASEDEEGEDSDDRDVQQGILDALAELRRETPGDVLVFLSGEQEIRDAADAVAGRFPEVEVLPLYGRLSAADQHRVFSRGTRPRVVLATNVAETSLTVPGIRYVVDAGTARISRYSPRAKVQRLPIEAISQASANQRSGRAGRTAPGIAIRLYAEDDFERRPGFTDPEILRTNLAAVILQMISLGLGDIAAFPFLTPPDPRGIQDGLDLLLELGAVVPVPETGTGAGAAAKGLRPGAGRARITPVGRELARLPVDPRFGRMLVEAKRQGVVREVAAIVAGLSIQDVRERPLEKRAQADQAHAQFADPTSDFLGLLKLWDHLDEQRRTLSSSAFRRMCRSEFLNYLRVREWQDLYRTLELGARAISGPRRDASADARLGRRDPDAIHRALLSGLLSRIGLRDDKTKGRGTEFLGSRQQRFAIFPGSSLAKKPPAAVMAAELVETSRLFARTVAAIDPAWAEPLAGDLVKRSYSEPRWEKRQGSAVADERVTLFGLPIVPRRRIQLARIDAVQARELLIRHALVGREWPYDISRNGLYAFDRDNRALRTELEELEDRVRRRDILSGDEALVDFFDARLPADVTDVRRFERWWKDARREQPDLLTMTRAELLEGDAEDAEAFPDEVAGFRLDYRFEPGADDDGITVEIPLARLPAVDPTGFDRLVPALSEELVTALIRTLPKAIRRDLVPAADWARRLLPSLPDDPGIPLTQALADAARTVAHVVVAPSDFDVGRLPPHLRMSFAAVDDRGRRVGSSKDLGELQARLADRTRSSIAKAVAPPRSALERDRVETWDLGDLPEVVENGPVRGYPALVDEGDHVALRVLATDGEQAIAHRRGVRRLIALTLPSPASYVQEHLTTAEKLHLATSPYRSVAALIEDAVLAVVDEVAGDRAPFDAPGFESLRQEVSAALIDRAFALVGLAARTLAAAREADKAISGASSMNLMTPLADARGQLEALIHPGFVRITGAAQLARTPVYLAGIVHRIERVADNLGRDRAWQAEVEKATTLYRDAGGPLPLELSTPARLAEVRWMLEELRLSLFAQPLGARGPVSVQRIRKALDGR